MLRTRCRAYSFQGRGPPGPHAAPGRRRMCRSRGLRAAPRCRACSSRARSTRSSPRAHPRVSCAVPRVSGGSFPTLERTRRRFIGARGSSRSCTSSASRRISRFGIRGSPRASTRPSRRRRTSPSPPSAIPTRSVPACRFLTWEAERARALMGPDYWPYGLEENAAVLEVFLRYHVEQGLSPDGWLPPTCSCRAPRRSGGCERPTGAGRTSRTPLSSARAAARSVRAWGGSPACWRPGGGERFPERGQILLPRRAPPGPAAT